MRSGSVWSACGKPLARSAVVIGSGPNGLAAAITLARAGLDVVVHEAAERIGGGMRTEELTLPGFRHDVCSAIHPLGRSSACFSELELDVEWLDSPACVAHPFDDAEAAMLYRDVGATAASLGSDGEAYRSRIGPLVAAWRAVEPLVLAPFPLDARAPLRAVRELGAGGSLRALRLALSSADAVARRDFATVRGRGFIAGNAAHSMLRLEQRPSMGFALALLVMGHTVGWPFPRGGSQALADALAAKLRECGGEIRVSSAVVELPRADVVLCDVSPASCCGSGASTTATSALCGGIGTGRVRSSSTGRCPARSRGVTSVAPRRRPSTSEERFMRSETPSARRSSRGRPSVRSCC